MDAQMLCMVSFRFTQVIVQRTDANLGHRA